MRHTPAQKNKRSRQSRFIRGRRQRRKPLNRAAALQRRRSPIRSSLRSSELFSGAKGEGTDPRVNVAPEGRGKRRRSMLGPFSHLRRLRCSPDAPKTHPKGVQDGFRILYDFLRGSRSILERFSEARSADKSTKNRKNREKTRFPQRLRFYIEFVPIFTPNLDPQILQNHVFS